MSSPTPPFRACPPPGSSLAQHAEHAPKPEEGGEEGGESKGVATLPPALAFAVRIALLRGHLLVGDELVKQQQWNAALPHFLHPSEEIYADIKGELTEYKVPPFETALKALAAAVKAKKGGNDYATALKSVNDALAAADTGMKEKQPDWAGFVVERGGRVAQDGGRRISAGDRRRPDRQAGRIPGRARLHLAGGADDRRRRSRSREEGCRRAARRCAADLPN